MFEKENDNNRDNSFEDRVQFLNDSQSIPTPIEAIALWAAVWLKQGGKVQSMNRNYISDDPMVEIISNNSVISMFGSTMPMSSAHAMGFNANDYHILDNNAPNYTDRAWTNWTPTIGENRVPEGYGSNALKLLVMNPIANVNDNPHRTRKGWEYGHTVLRVLDGNIHDGFTASTNETLKINVPQDIYKLATQRDAIKKLCSVLSGENKKVTDSENNTQIMRNAE